MSATRKPSVFDDPESYPGIVLHQPHAGLIRLAGLGLPGKMIETRRRRIYYRGPLVIVASRRGCTADNLLVAHVRARQLELEWPELLGEALTRRLDKMEREVVESALSHCGEAVALFDVSDCRPLLPADIPESFAYEPGMWAWCSSRIRPLRPFPVRGHQGFLRVPRARVDAAICSTKTKED